VALLLDTGILYSRYDCSDAWHRRAVAVVQTEKGELIVPSPVVPEVDHLLGRRLGAKARQVSYRALADGDFLVVDLPASGMGESPS
jgi:predicted nucleic acid-binding protein